jgi:HD-GYP domain-containing protein (c-di-GMP phosphodiesterase class II)
VILSLVLLGVAVAAGEVLVLRIGRPGPIPLSYAIYPVIAARFSVPAFAVAVAAGTVAGLLVSRPTVVEGGRRLLCRIAVAAAVVAAYRSTFGALDHQEVARVVLTALAAAALAAIVVDELVRFGLRRRSAFAGRGLLAWLTVASSGALMALGYRGVDGRGIVGLWGVALFATPLLAAWYSFERVDRITRISAQTVDALSRVPEYAGLVDDGHGERVAALAVAMGDRLDLGPSQLSALDTAARLHHLGAVTLDGDRVVAVGCGDVAPVTAAMLHDIEELGAPRSIIEGTAGTATAVLHVANAYDELVAGDDRRASSAIGALRSAPEDAYDPVVVDALVRVVEERSCVRGRAERVEPVELLELDQLA